jgi:hypothetical protein
VVYQQTSNPMVITTDADADVITPGADASSGYLHQCYVTLHDKPHFYNLL